MRVLSSLILFQGAYRALPPQWAVKVTHCFFDSVIWGVQGWGVQAEIDTYIQVTRNGDPEGIRNPGLSQQALQWHGSGSKGAQGHCYPMQTTAPPLWQLLPLHLWPFLTLTLSLSVTFSALCPLPPSCIRQTPDRIRLVHSHCYCW